MSVQYPAVFSSTTSEWTSISSPGIPEGGDEGQVLVKSSSANYATMWVDFEANTVNPLLLMGA